MQHFCYLFEAKSIQSYLLATNRLKEIIGGSELIELLTGDDGLFDKALDAVGGKFECSRKGGGAAFAFTTDKDARDRLAALWPLVLAKFAPDLEFVQARGAGESPKDAYDQATGKTRSDDATAQAVDLRADRNQLSARVPQAGPFAVRNRRSGDVAVSLKKSKKDGEREPVWMLSRIASCCASAGTARRCCGASRRPPAKSNGRST